MEDTIWITRCFNILHSCVCSDYIEDKNHILEKLDEFLEVKDCIPKELYKEATNYIEKNINPILYDKDYWEFTEKSEYGEFNKEGVFVVNSEKSMYEICYLFLENSEKLIQELLYIFSKYYV